MATAVARLMPRAQQKGGRRERTLSACEWLQPRGSLQHPFHGDDKRLFFVGPAMGHQGSRPGAAIVACEMRNLGGNEDDLTALENLRSLSLDLDRHASLNDKEDFLGARVHVPGSCRARRHF